MEVMYLAAEGWRVFPCAPADKRPLVKWADEATTNPETIWEWWQRWPDALIGMPTGGPADLVVVDLDQKNGKDGAATLRRFESELGQLPNGPRATTRSGGSHLYFRSPHMPIRNSGSKLGRHSAPGVDLRGHGGFVVVPPSAGYSWEVPGPNDAPELPVSWVHCIKRLDEQKEYETRRRLHGTPGSLAIRLRDEIARAPRGARNDTLNRCAFVFGLMVRDGVLDEYGARALLVDAMGDWPAAQRDVRKDELTAFGALDDGRHA